MLFAYAKKKNKLIPITTNTLISLAGFPQWQLYISISKVLYNQRPTVLLNFACKPFKSKLRMQRGVGEMKSEKPEEFRNSQSVVAEQQQLGI